MLKALFIAMGLLTRIPVPKIFHIDKNDDKKLYGYSVIFYPFVGLIIGSLLSALYFFLSYLSLTENGLLEAGLILTFWVLITGALHLDGLADSADAWLGGYGNKTRTLEIMKDPYSGPAAVVILVLVLLLKFSVIIEINWQILLLAPVLGRTAAMVLLASTPYMRKKGMGELAAHHLSIKWVSLMTVMVFISTVLLLGVNSLFLIPLFIVGYLLRKMMLSRIGGVTGDTTGALIEVIELASIVFFILMLNLL